MFCHIQFYMKGSTIKHGIDNLSFFSQTPNEKKCQTSRCPKPNQPRSPLTMYSPVIMAASIARSVEQEAVYIVMGCSSMLQPSRHPTYLVESFRPLNVIKGWVTSVLPPPLHRLTPRGRRSISTWSGRMMRSTSMIIRSRDRAREKNAIASLCVVLVISEIMRTPINELWVWTNSSNLGSLSQLYRALGIFQLWTGDALYKL